LLFTDGLYEVEGPNQQLYTSEMLLDAVSRRTRLPAAKLCDELLAEIKEFAMGLDFTDDVCLVAMEVAGEK
jgi:sigma-B regulation protein RsbU (phosphoserine phosphatase)